MIKVSRLISQARLWIDTPYLDQQCMRGVGCDCVGLFRGLGSELGLNVVQNDDYPIETSGAELLHFLEMNCTRQPNVRTPDEARVGSIIAMNMRSDEGPHHLVLRTDVGVLHAFGAAVREEAVFGRQRFHSAWWHKGILPCS